MRHYQFWRQDGTTGKVLSSQTSSTTAIVKHYSHISLAFSGKYVCRAISPLGEASCSVDLCVEPADHQEVEFEGSPVFLVRTEPRAAKLGEAVNFKCTIAGTPQPKVSFTLFRSLFIVI